MWSYDGALKKTATGLYSYSNIPSQNATQKDMGLILIREPNDPNIGIFRKKTINAQKLVDSK